MKLSSVLCLLSLSLAIAQPGPGGTPGGAPAQDPAGIARKALDALLGQNFAGYSAVLSPQLKASTTQERFTKFGEQIKNWGAVQKVGDPAVQHVGPATLVTIPVSFASQEINFVFGVNASGEVSGMVPRPVSGGWQPPSYSKAGSFKERNVVIGEGDWKLPGTLAVPAGAGAPSGPFPAVLLVLGFGPRDRDNTNDAVKVFRDLSDGLASRGIVVLRYEKRTREYAQRMAGKPYTPGDETVDDAETALDVLRAQPEVDAQHVYLLGHDLGGYLAPQIAGDDEKLAGAIVMGANARPLEDVMVEMVENYGVSKQDLDLAKSAASRVKKLEEADADAPPLLGLPASYWLDLKGYDAVAEAAKLTIPILVLGGGRDFQAPATDFNLWKTGLANRKNVTAKLYPAMNHLFVAGEGKSTEEEYKKPGHVAPEVVDDIAKFMGK